MINSTKEVKNIYENWDHTSDITSDLQEWYDRTLDYDSNDREDLIDLAKYVITDFKPDKGNYWLNWAISYLSHGLKTEEKIAALENIIKHYARYKFSGTSLNSAARALGSIATHPNQALANAISFEENAEEEEWHREAVTQYRIAAYSGYIIAATDYQTGIDAARAIKNSGKIPTLEGAEKVIRKWQKERNSI